MQLELQQKLFEEKLSRRNLLNYSAKHWTEYHVQVFRNHSFELVEHVMGIFLDYAEINVQITYSSYDDSFSFVDLNPKSNMILLWVDTTHYNNINVTAFFKERISVLQANYGGAVLMIPYGERIDLDIPGITVWNLDDISKQLGDDFADIRTKASSGTPLSAKALLLISRQLGLRYFPALLRPSLKAVVVDLDNTLYQGILGEDGSQGIVLTEGYRALQKHLKHLVDEGFFLCIASKNELSDVKNLFNARHDFPLQISDFSIIQASWETKVNMISRISEFLNINPDSMVFIDDNIGELTTVKTAYPMIKLIYAKNGEITKSVLEEFPGLMKLQTLAEDQKRRLDIQVKQERILLQNRIPLKEYILSLSIHLHYDCDNPVQSDRIFELANKTNQFIFNYKRYSRHEIEQLMLSSQYTVITVSLCDKLSDSGLIGVCIARDEANYMVIEECFISCRALGRGIEKIIVFGAIAKASKILKKNKVRVLFQNGPRNLPAKEFVSKYLMNYLEKEMPFSYDIPYDLVKVTGF